MKNINMSALQIAARYHDIGKIKIPQRILSKKTALTDAEKRHIMVHSKFSSQILEHTGHSSDVVKYAMLHHENCDGSGYPFGLKKEKIPLESRIIRVADVFDALHSKRAYKEALPIDMCLSIMKKEQSAYDFMIVDILEIFLRKV